MSGSKVNNFSIGDSNIQSVMLTLDKAYKGLHQVSLTNYDNTAESQIAAGSVVENNGALYTFNSNESITGSPSDGTVYIRLVPNGDTITAEYTNTAPTWSDSKQGWYGTGGDANKRYLEFVLYKIGSNWVLKQKSLIGQKYLPKILCSLEVGANLYAYSSSQIVKFSNVLSDNWSLYDTSDGKIHIIVSGFYNVQFNFSGAWTTGTAGEKKITIEVRKNNISPGEILSYNETNSDGSIGAISVSGSKTLPLNAGDYLEVLLSRSMGLSVVIPLVQSSNFSIEKVDI